MLVTYNTCFAIYLATKQCINFYFRGHISSFMTENNSSRFFWTPGISLTLLSVLFFSLLSRLFSLVFFLSRSLSGLSHRVDKVTEIEHETAKTLPLCPVVGQTRDNPWSWGGSGTIHGLRWVTNGTPQARSYRRRTAVTWSLRRRRSVVAPSSCGRCGRCNVVVDQNGAV